MAGPLFPSLKSLHLSTRRINDLTLAAIKSISSTDLHRLELTVKARAESHLSEEFLLAHMTALSQAPFRNSLREVKLYLHHEEQVDLQYSIGSQILQPVLGFGGTGCACREHCIICEALSSAHQSHDTHENRPRQCLRPPWKMRRRRSNMATYF
ncbi:uncharacterized protein C8Q71DRAFT_128699 [Rhodofomes roseus]|uniref:Uncharacterized protein n=1 Tax=Rhodofomes roseus TaxID=34475 RepID=A0ABQ8KBE3_9APHY|nr:uncharacterized protein C8Q71DRAFT_128699 [Rhodofomes roseus]KAH9834877.1 hypothetical protein C8Q71DRAFT_128699 [Rhodofomes roseus]